MTRFVSKSLLFLTTISAPITLGQQAPQPPAVLRNTISQIASGNGWRTTVTLVNLTSAANAVGIAFVGDDGTQLALPLVIRQEGPVLVQPDGRGFVNRSIPPFATLVIESAASTTSPAIAGWADVISDSPIAGFAIFRQRGQDGRDQEGTAPLEGIRLAGLILPFDNTEDSSAGVALVNASGTPAVLKVEIRDENGVLLKLEALALPGRGHTAFIVAEKFPSSLGRRGTVEFQNTGSQLVTGLGLRFTPSGGFTSIPVIPIAAR